MSRSRVEPIADYAEKTLLKNIVACSHLREFHFIEDTTGGEAALHYLRDKEKHEVDFLPVIDNRPVKTIEVKVSDDKFSGILHDKSKVVYTLLILYFGSEI